MKLVKGSSSSGTSGGPSGTAAIGSCFHLAIPTIATEVSYNLGAIKKFTISSQKRAVLTVSFVSAGDFLTIPRGASYMEDGLSTGPGFTLYFTSSIANDIIEIVTWV